MAFLWFTICIASRRCTENIGLQDQVAGLSCSALSRFPESMSQSGLLHADAGRVLQAPNPLPCSGTNRELSRADAANHLYDDGPP